MPSVAQPSGRRPPPLASVCATSRGGEKTGDWGVVVRGVTGSGGGRSGGDGRGGGSPAAGEATVRGRPAQCPISPVGPAHRFYGHCAAAVRTRRGAYVCRALRGGWGGGAAGAGRGGGRGGTAGRGTASATRHPRRVGGALTPGPAAVRHPRRGDARVGAAATGGRWRLATPTGHVHPPPPFPPSPPKSSLTPCAQKGGRALWGQLSTQSVDREPPRGDGRPTVARPRRGPVVHVTPWRHPIGLPSGHPLGPQVGGARQPAGRVIILVRSSPPPPSWLSPPSRLALPTPLAPPP